MNGSDLIAEAAAAAGMSQAELRRALQAVSEVAARTLAEGAPVRLPGLGTLQPRQLSARTIRSVSDMRRMRLGERWSLRFRPARPLREAVAARAPQHWREPAHQEAWRMSEALISDLALYHVAQVPRLAEHASDEAVHRACAEAFGGLWAQVVDSYRQSVPDTVRATSDHLAAAARTRWAP